MQKWIQCLSNKLFDFRLSERKGISKFFFRWLRIFVLATQGFSAHGCSLYASALTFFTLLSLVPIFAISLAVTRGFGEEKRLQEQMLARFPEHAPIFTELFKFAEKMLAEIQGGIIAGLGALVLFWSVTSLLRHMESALDKIWKVGHLRSWKRLFFNTFSLTLIAPVAFLIANSAMVVLVSRLEAVAAALPWTQGWLFLFHLFPFALYFGLFALIYLLLPNQKVQWQSACIAALITSVFYVVLQVGYVIFQKEANQYGAVYGSLAVLPLFLIWLQLSWGLFLFGGEISCAIQTASHYEFKAEVSEASLSLRRLISLWFVQLCVYRFAQGKPLLTQKMLAEEYLVPYGFIQPLLAELVRVKVLDEAKEGGYLPREPIVNLKIADVVSKLEGTDHVPLKSIDLHLLAPLEEALKAMTAELKQSPKNKRFMDMSLSAM